MVVYIYRQGLLENEHNILFFTHAMMRLDELLKKKMPFYAQYVTQSRGLCDHFEQNVIFILTLRDSSRSDLVSKFSFGVGTTNK